MSVQFNWDGKSGAITSAEKYQLLYSKPVVTGVTYDTVTYDSDCAKCLKTIGNKAIELTEGERAALNKYAVDNSVQSPWTPNDSAITAHNADLNAHGGIHYQLSEIAEVAQKVCSVYTIEYDLKTLKPATDTKLHWNFVAMDIGNCTLATDDTVWVAPFAESYDVYLNLHFSSAVTEAQSISVTFWQNETNISTKQVQIAASNNPSKLIKLDGITLPYKSRLSVSISAPKAFTEGAFLPFRTYLTVASHGDCTAQRYAKLMYTTIAGLTTTLGTSIYTKPSTTDPSKTRVIAGTWNANTEAL